MPGAVWRCDTEGGCCSCPSGLPAPHSPWDLQSSLQSCVEVCWGQAMFPAADREMTGVSG